MFYRQSLLRRRSRANQLPANLITLFDDDNFRSNEIMINSVFTEDDTKIY